MILFVGWVGIGLLVHELSCCSLLCMYVSLCCFVLDGCCGLLMLCGGFVDSVVTIIILFIWRLCSLIYCLVCLSVLALCIVLWGWYAFVVCLL